MNNSSRLRKVNLRRNIAASQFTEQTSDFLFACSDPLFFAISTPRSPNHPTGKGHQREQRSDLREPKFAAFVNRHERSNRAEIVELIQNVYRFWRRRRSCGGTRRLFCGRGRSGYSTWRRSNSAFHLNRYRLTPQRDVVFLHWIEIGERQRRHVRFLFVRRDHRLKRFLAADSYVI